jgi:hypothetical protein
MNRQALSLLLAAALLAPAGVMARPPGPAPELAGLTWLAGTWAGSLGEGAYSEETWSTPAGACMVGMWRLVKDGKPRVLELLTLTVEDGAVVMRLRHHDGSLVAWEEKDAPLALELVKKGDREAVFEGKEDGKPLRLTYRRTGDRLDVVLEKPDAREQYSFSKAE